MSEYDEVDLTDLLSSTCIHCRITGIIGQWMQDFDGAGRWLDRLQEVQPALQGVDREKLAFDTLSSALAEVFSDLINSASVNGHDITSMLAVFTQELSDRTGSVQARYEKATPPTSGGMH